MNIKYRYIGITVVLVVISSSLSGAFGYRIGKQEGVYEKDSAVKGIEYDLRDQLSKEALDKAQAIVDEETGTPEGSGQKVIKSFYKLISEEDFEGAWELLSEDYKKTLKSVNTFKNSYKNIKSIELKSVEFRTSSPLSEMDVVTLDVTYKNPTIVLKDGKTEFFVNTTLSNEKWLIDDISKE